MCAEQVMAVMPNRYYSPGMAYAGMVGALDTAADITGTYPMGGGLGQSVFGGGCGMPFGMGMPGMGMGGMGMGGMGMGYCGYGPGQEYMNMDTKTAMGYQNDLRYQQLEGGVELGRRTEDANHRANIYNNMVAEKVGVLSGLIKENNQDQIPTAYESLKDTVREKLKHDSNRKEEPLEQTVDTVAKKLYTEALQGKNIGDTLREHGDSPFMAGFKRGFGGIGTFSLGSALMDKRTSAENIADIEGTKIASSEKAKERLGMVVSGILSVVGAVVLWKAGKAIFKPSTVKVLTKSEGAVAKALTQEEKLANMQAHIKGLEADPRIAGLLQENKECCANISELYQGHIDGYVDLTSDEKVLLEAHSQATAAASKLKADMFAAKHNKIMSS